MNSKNRYLAQMSMARAAWVSVQFVLENLPLVLSVALVFCLAPDLVSEWIASSLLKGKVANATAWLAYLPTLLSFQLNMLGYSALAWCVGEAIEGRAPSITMAVRRFSGRRLFRILGTIFYATLLMLWPLLAYAAFLGIIVTVVKTSSTALRNLVIIVIFSAWVVASAMAFINLLNYCLAEFPAIFEDTFFRAAALRSKALVKGRRIWLVGVLVIFSIALILVSLGLTVGLPSLMRWPPADATTVYGLARIAYGSLVNAIIMAFWIVFQTLIYFRLRREKHDLTFFDLSNTEILRPAAKAVGTLS